MAAEDRKEDKQREIECIGLNYLSVPNHVILDKQILTGVSYVHGIGADSLLKIHVSIQTFRLPLGYDHPSDRDKVGRRPLGLTQGTILRYLNPAPRVSGAPGWWERVAIPIRTCIVAAQSTTWQDIPGMVTRHSNPYGRQP